jgi:hypothetical protein
LFFRQFTGSIRTSYWFVPYFEDLDIQNPETQGPGELRDPTETQGLTTRTEKKKDPETQTPRHRHGDQGPKNTETQKPKVPEEPKDPHHTPETQRHTETQRTDTETQRHRDTETQRHRTQGYKDPRTQIFIQRTKDTKTQGPGELRDSHLQDSLSKTVNKWIHYRITYLGYLLFRQFTGSFRTSYWFVPYFEDLEIQTTKQCLTGHFNRVTVGRLRLVFPDLV